jgi:hypothetical protein
VISGVCVAQCFAFCVLLCEPLLVFLSFFFLAVIFSVIRFSESHYGSTLSEPSLTIFNTDLSDSGIYECGFENAIGIGYGSSIQVVIRGM